MDATDKKLLVLLQQDAKRTTKELSDKLNLSVTAVVIVPVYLVKGKRGTSGLNVKTAALAVGATVPEIIWEPCLILNEAALTVVGFISVLKVTEINLPSATSTALSRGSVETTTGQTLTIPDTSVTFLQPAAKMTSRNAISHLLLKSLT